MPGIRFTVVVEGKVKFNRAFQRFDLAVTDLSPVWPEVQEEFYAIESDQFQSGGAAGASGAWQPLSPAYLKIKIKKYGSLALIAGVLRATDAMYKSLTRETKDSVFETTEDSLTIGTKLPYAKYHQNGEGNLPQREVISFSATQKKSLQKRIQKKLLEQMRETGFVATEENFTEVG